MKARSPLHEATRLVCRAAKLLEQAAGEAPHRRRGRARVEILRTHLELAIAGRAKGCSWGEAAKAIETVFGARYDKATLRRYVLDAERSVLREAV